MPLSFQIVQLTLVWESVTFTHRLQIVVDLAMNQTCVELEGGHLCSSCSGFQAEGLNVFILLKIDLEPCFLYEQE